MKRRAPLVPRLRRACPRCAAVIGSITVVPVHSAQMGPTRPEVAESWRSVAGSGRCHPRRRAGAVGYRSFEYFRERV
jgi:hypothetical protein